MLPPLLACLGLHATLWEPATRVEVYALSTFFAVWAAARIASSSGPSTSTAMTGGLLQAGIALGLSASSNPMIALCTGVALSPSILARVIRRRLPVRALALAIVGGIVGLLPYLYVEIAARRRDVFVWGAPRDAESRWRYFTLQEFTSHPPIATTLWVEHGLAWFAWALQHGLMPMVALGVGGQIVLGSRTKLGRSAGPLVLLLLVAVVSWNSVWHLDVPDYTGYVATALWMAAAGTAALCAQIRALGHARGAYVIAGLLVLTSVTASPGLFERTRHRDLLARQLAQRVLFEAPQNAIVIAQLDQFAGTLLYLQEVESQRLDVIVLAYGLADSSWYWERIEHEHPNMARVVLRGEGGKPGRVNRLLRANAARPVLVEHIGIAQELGLRACVGGLYLRTGSACDVRHPFDPQVPRLFENALASLGRGSPSADGAIALSSYLLGDSLWRVGEPRAALRVLLAGVPKDMQPPDPGPVSGVERAGTLTRSLRPYARDAALGDPARNLFLASALLASAGLPQAALRYLRAAANDDLPEAVTALAGGR
jgi:hypothetical protein